MYQLKSNNFYKQEKTKKKKTWKLHGGKREKKMSYPDN
jgi:hypothetical protein